MAGINEMFTRRIFENANYKHLGIIIADFPGPKLVDAVELANLRGPAFQWNSAIKIENYARTANPYNNYLPSSEALCDHGRGLEILNHDLRREQFCIRGWNNQVLHRWQQSPGGYWSSYANLSGGNNISKIKVKILSDGRLIVGIKTHPGRYYETSQVCAGCGWHQWNQKNSPLL